MYACELKSEAKEELNKKAKKIGNVKKGQHALIAIANEGSADGSVSTI